jgi:hypothetical protein
VSRSIYEIPWGFYHEAAGRQLLTGMVIGHQTFGDVRVVPQRSEERSRQCSAGTRISTPEQQFARIATRPIVLESGFDDEGTFFFIPFSGLQSMVGVVRRRVIKLLVERKILNGDFARNDAVLSAHEPAL